MQKLRYVAWACPLFLPLIFLIFLFPSVALNLNRSSIRRAGSPLILPLVFSSPNSSRSPSLERNYRRQLQKVDHRITNARMSLYDDLLSNGYYTTRIAIGTPPPQFALIVDTGSTVTYVPCAQCIQCGNHQFQIGLITFDMSLNVNYSDLAPHIAELAEHIAHELEVKTYQAHLLNSAGKGNGCLIRWGIFPAGSSNYISNSTAKSIIHRLTDHLIHLPDAFGTYQLVKWKVERPPKRTWWQQHFWAVIVAVLIAMVLGLSTTLTWYVWRHGDQVLGRYRPVNDGMLEQELSQLKISDGLVIQ